jgi:hypothetical protein
MAAFYAQHHAHSARRPFPALARYRQERVAVIPHTCPGVVIRGQKYKHRDIPGPFGSSYYGFLTGPFTYARRRKSNRRREAGVWQTV